MSHLCPFGEACDQNAIRARGEFVGFDSMLPGARTQIDLPKMLCAENKKHGLLILALCWHQLFQVEQSGSARSVAL